MASSLQRRYRANGQTISRHGSDAGTTDSRTSSEHETYRQTREDDPKPTTELMSAIQLGIGQSIGSLASKANRDVLLQDFYTVQGVFFPREGSNLTPAHHHSDYRFKTYAPIAFRYFRELFGIQPDDFLLSLCNDPLNELSNPGASGSIFYITNDDEFIIKTVQHKEADFLQKLLPGYYMNLNQNPRTLLPKFYGLYCYQCGGKNIRFVIMNNLLPSSIKMHEKYDLKGSTYKRKASKHERSKKSPTLKDLDFIENHPDGIMLEGDTHMALIKTIERDCRVLQSFKIMDYSLLLGIHNLDQAAREREFEQMDASADLGSGTQGENQFGSLTRGRSVRQRLAQYSTAMEAIAARSEPLDLDNEDIPPGGIPARNARGERLLLYIGVIDILQSYRLKKKLEHAMKAFVHDGDTISVHRPGFYGQRFQGFFAEKVFKKIPSLDQPQVKGPHMRFKKLVQLALKHSPSKRKGPGRQRSVTQQSENDKLTPAEKVTEVNAKSASDVAELGAVGGRPDLLPDSTPPPTFSEATGQRLSEAGRVLMTEGDHQRAVFHTRSNPEVITTSASFHSSTGAVSEADQAALPGSPAYSISESTPTHTECTEGTPSFTTSSPSCSSDMLVDSTTVSMRSLSKSQGSAAAPAELPSDSTTENEIKRNSTVTVERTSTASTIQQTSSRTSTTNVQSSVTHYPNPSQEADGQVALSGEKHQLRQSVTTTTTNVEIAASEAANATGDSGAGLATQGSPVEET